MLIAFLAVLVILKPKITINSNSPKNTLEQQSAIIEKEFHKENPNVTNTIRSAEEILKEEYYPRYQLLKEVEGNFSPCGNIKRLFLLNDTRRHLGSEKHKLNLHILLAYDENQGKMIEHPYRTGFVDDDLLKRIKPLELILGSWNGYFYTYDLNQNGVDELVGFGFFSADFSPAIYEYQDGGFAQILDYSDPSGFFVRVEFPKEKQIKIYGNGDLDAIPRKYPWKLYEWSEDERRYVIIEEGSVTELPQ